MNGVRMKKIVCVCLLGLIGFANIVDAAQAPEHEQVEPMRQHPFDYVAETKREVPADAKCPDLWAVLRKAGWAEKDVVKADRIVWRESRCIATAHNKNDPNTVQGVKGSLGLFQINLYWIQKTRWYPNGYLQTVLGQELSPTDLFDVEVSVAAAGAMIAYDRGLGRCGWSAWLGC